MKTCRIFIGCTLASILLLSGGAAAQVVTEFSAGITASTIADRLLKIEQCHSGEPWRREICLAQPVELPRSQIPRPARNDTDWRDIA